jgi:Amidase
MRRCPMHWKSRRSRTPILHRLAGSSALFTAWCSPSRISTTPSICAPLRAWMPPMRTIAQRAMQPSSSACVKRVRSSWPRRISEKWERRTREVPSAGRSVTLTIRNVVPAPPAAAPDHRLPQTWRRAPSERKPGDHHPAKNNSIVGLAPTQELVSRDGMVGAGLNTRVGPLCRTVKDVARVLEVIAGYDPKDELTAFSIGRLPAEPYRSFANERTLNGMRIGVIREHMDKKVFNEADGEAIDLAERAIGDLRRLGATIVDPGAGGALFQSCINKYVPLYRNRVFIEQFPNLFPVDSSGKPSTDRRTRVQSQRSRSRRLRERRGAPEADWRHRRRAKSLEARASHRGRSSPGRAPSDRSKRTDNPIRFGLGHLGLDAIGWNAGVAVISAID